MPADAVGRRNVQLNTRKVCCITEQSDSGR